MSKSRDPWFDNARWLAGSLVVLVHTTSGFIGANDFVGWQHTAFWPFRIPLFAILVGYFTAQNPGERDHSNLIRMVVVPFGIITGLHVALNFWWGREPFVDVLRAEYTLWFLIAVIVWRVLTPLLMRFRQPLLVAIAVSLLAGCFRDLWAFEMHRVLGHLPFFVLGIMLRRDDRWLRRRTPLSVFLASGVVAAWLVGAWIAFRTGSLRRMTFAMATEYHAGNLSGMWIRFLVLVGGSVTALCLLHLIPRRRITYVTYIGAGGFTIYLFHGLVLRFTRQYEWLPLASEQQWWTVPALVLFSFALAALLASTPVRWLTRPLVRPRLAWLIRVAEPASGGGAHRHVAESSRSSRVASAERPG